jgi:long-chain acyl-CoA synthetase
MRINKHERPQGIALLGRPFSIETGELTPNLKIRRGAVESRHAALIEKIYAAIDSARAAGTDGLVVI